MMISVADFDEKIEAILCLHLLLTTAVGDPDVTHQLFREVGASLIGGACIEYLGDVGVIHEGQCLLFSLEAGDDLFCVHDQFDDLKRDAAADRFSLFGDIDHAIATFTDAFEQLVTTCPEPVEWAERLVDCFVVAGSVEKSGAIFLGTL
jgi:hypothetical protein